MNAHLMRTVDRHHGADTKEGAGNATAFARLAQSASTRQQAETRLPKQASPSRSPRGVCPSTEPSKGRQSGSAVNEETATRGQDGRGQRS
jgi:hypothetical protein